jgi:type IV secretory pathway VirD2 relaxase
MSDEDEFRPRLGRIRSIGGRAAKRFTARLYARMEKARPGVFAKRSGARFSGARIGRGAGVAASFAHRAHPFAKFRARRVAVKIRSVRLGKNGRAKARAHLRYIQRDGAERDGTPGKLYGPARDAVDGEAFLEEGKTDRHQFRIILSPEEAGELKDLEAFTRDVMASAERDLGTKLDWVAVNHYDTDHPHVHVVLRGRADDGRDLVIARNYIAHGFRGRAEERATLELGERRDLEIARGRMREATQERFTSIDGELQELSAGGVVTFGEPRTVYDRFRSKLFMARLRTLEAMQLARRDREGWRLSPAMEETLRGMGRRGDIIRSMEHAVGDRLSLHHLRDFAGETAPLRLIGRVIGSGAADDVHDRRFLALDGADGNQWHVEVDLKPGAMPPEGAIIEVSRGAGTPRKSDLTIAAIAERNGGVYSNELHEIADPRSTADYRLTHKRRLEALRRARVVEREADGSWRVPDDYLQRAAEFERGRATANIRVLSFVSLEELPQARARTLLDDALESHEKFETVPAGFGGELRGALVARRRWLIEQGLATEEGARLVINRKRLALMEHETVAAAGARLSKQLGKAFDQPVEGERLTGIYRRSVDLPAGRFAVVERSKEFSLGPWREALETRRGLEISGVVKRGGITWEFGRTRGGPAL